MSGATVIGRAQDHLRRTLRMASDPPPRRVLSLRARITRGVGWVGLVSFLAVAPFALHWAGPAFAVDYGLVIAMAVLAVSILGWIGEISLAPVAQMGCGVVVVNLCQNAGIPLALTIPIVAVSSVPVSLLLAAFTLRFKGVSFAIATLAFAYMAQKTFFQTYLGTYGAFGGDQTKTVTRPDLIASDESFSYVILGSLVVIAAVCYAVQRSRIGARLTALRESEMAMSVLGHPPAAYRFLAICLSGAIASVAGAYYVLLHGVVPSIYFQPALAVLYFGFAVAGGLGSIGGAMAAGAVFGALPRYLETLSEGRFVAYEQFFIGLVVFAVLLVSPGGLAEISRRVWRRVEGAR